MRQITALAINAFNNNYNFKRDNTEIRVIEACGGHHNEMTQMRLHGNIIAQKSNSGLTISTCGWATNTTKERLNGLYGVNIVQRNYEWYLNGEHWSGQAIKVN